MMDRGWGCVWLFPVESPFAFSLLPIGWDLQMSAFSILIPNFSCTTFWITTSVSSGLSFSTSLTRVLIHKEREKWIKLLFFREIFQRISSTICPIDLKPVTTPDSWHTSRCRQIASQTSSQELAGRDSCQYGNIILIRNMFFHEKKFLFLMKLVLKNEIIYKKLKKN